MNRDRSAIGTARTAAVVLFAVLSAFTCFAQPEMQPGMVDVAPTFQCDILCYRGSSRERARVDLYLQITYDRLRFIKHDDSFAARFEVVVSVLLKDGRQLTERSWRSGAMVKEFTQTRSKKLSALASRTFDLLPNDYVFRVQVQDLESGVTARVERPVHVRDFRTGSLLVSDLMLVNRMTQERDRKAITPNLSGVLLSAAEPFYFFFEGYQTLHSDSLDVVYTINTVQGNVVASGMQRERMADSITQILVPVSVPTLEIGTYIARVALRIPGDTVLVDSARAAQKVFSLRHYDLPIQIKDLDKAVDQLIYIAKDSEIEYIRNAPTQEEKQKRFLEFWAKRNPDPGSERNELMIEYYQRIAYTNATFTTFMEGWKSDRGMVYIRFGPPENIERHPFEYDSKPYEIWYYYQLNRQFIFVDETGFGEYRLRYPTTDLWGRAR